jgi:hypothetical protein
MLHSLVPSDKQGPADIAHAYAGKKIMEPDVNVMVPRAEVSKAATYRITRSMRNIVTEPGGGIYVFTQYVYPLWEGA